MSTCANRFPICSSNGDGGQGLLTLARSLRREPILFNARNDKRNVLYVPECEETP